ncbi:MAG: DUF2147 domain-containing protein [Phenylobacterium sp.]
MNDPVKWIAGLAAVGLALGLSARAHAAPASALGDWLTEGGGGKVRIAACPDQAQRLCGALVWLKQPNGPDGAPIRDTANPDAALRARPLLGIGMIRDFRGDGPGHWTDGRIYDPNSGRTYRSRMRLNPDGALKVDGCVLVVCVGQTWTRP